MHWVTKIGAILILALLWGNSLLFADEPFTGGSIKKPEAAIASIRKRCHAILNEAMASEEAFVRSGAVRAAGESNDPELIPLLEKGSRDFYPTTRLFAVQGIHKISKDHTKTIARREARGAHRRAASRAAAYSLLPSEWSVPIASDHVGRELT